MHAIDFENMLVGVAGRDRFAAAARNLQQSVRRNSHAEQRVYLILNVTFCTTLKKEQVAMTAQTPNQKFLAYIFPSTWNTVSSRISPKKFAASVLFEKSMPEAFSGASDEAPPIDIDISMMAVLIMRLCVDT